MIRYIRFQTAENGAVLVEVDEPEQASSTGIQKTGAISDRVQGVVAEAKSTFDDVMHVLAQTAAAFRLQLDSLEKPPTEAELAFAMKITAEAGNVAIAKLGGEANYSVKLTWKKE